MIDEKVLNKIKLKVSKGVKSPFVNEYKTYLSLIQRDYDQPLIFDKQGNWIEKTFIEMPNEPVIKKYELS